MKINKTMFFIFALLIAAIFTGCGGSSNPVGTPQNSGLVNVSGKINNAQKSLDVAFMTADSLFKNNMAVNNSFRASLNNESGIYRCSTDSNGNYSILLPENDYYLIAESDDRKAVSGKINVSSRAAMQQVDVELVETVNISGNLKCNPFSVVANVPVSIEGKPFIAVTDANGNFYFNSVPLMNCNLSCAVNVNGVLYTGKAEVSKDSMKSGTRFSFELTASQDSPISSVEVKGKVLYRNTEKAVENKKVMALLSDSNKLCVTNTDETGAFSFKNIDSTNETVLLTLDMVDFVTVSINKLTSESNIVLYSESYLNEAKPLVIEPENNSSTGSNSSVGISQLSFKNPKIFVLKETSDGSYEKCFEDELGFELTGRYTVGNFLPGNYTCFLVTTNQQTNNSHSFDIYYAESISLTDDPNANKVVTFGDSSNKFTATVDNISAQESDNDGYDYVLINNIESNSFTFKDVAYEKIGNELIPMNVRKDSASVKSIIDITSLVSGEHILVGGFKIIYKEAEMDFLGNDFGCVIHKTATTN